MKTGPPSLPRGRSPPVHAGHRPRCRSERMLVAALLALTACIENRVSVELFTQIHGDGSCTRRVEYRLERVDTNKGDARVEIRPEDDVLVRWHRFPSGEPWQVREETGDRPPRGRPRGPPALARRRRRRLLPRARAPRAARPQHRLRLRRPRARRLRVPGGPPRPLLPPRRRAGALSRGAEARRGPSPTASRPRSPGKGAAPRESDVRRAYREQLAEPFAREVALLAERPALRAAREARARRALRPPRRRSRRTSPPASRPSPRALPRGRSRPRPRPRSTPSATTLLDAARGGRAPPPHARGRRTASTSAPPS